MSIQQQRQFIENIAPFNELSQLLLNDMAGAVDVVYFQMGASFEISLSENAFLFFVIKGRVAEFDSAKRHQATYGAHTFFGEAVLLKQEDRLFYEVTEEAILYRLPQDIFLACLTSESVKSFFVDDITTKLNKHHSQLQAESSSEMMMASVSQAPLKKLVILPQTTSIKACVMALNEANTDACIVEGDEGQQGIVTITDLLNALALKDAPLSSAIGSLANYPVVSVHQFDYLFNALLKMTQHHINRLAVRSDTGLIGFLHQKELMSMFANQSGLVTFSIQQADDLETLKTAMGQIDSLVASLFNRGVKTHYIAKLVNALHRKVIEKVVQICDKNNQFNQACFLVMGSEGRAEQVLRTDQDNALLLPDALEYSTAELQAYTDALTQALVTLGFPRCSGNIMVCNPLWSKKFTEFNTMIKDWLRSPNENTFMNLAIFVDAEPVCGDEQLLLDTKKMLLDWIAGHKQFLSHFAKPVLQFETPVSFFGSLVTENIKQESKIDLKKGGIFPIVHGVRCLAMERGITKNNTHWRIKALMDQKVLTEKFGLELGETLNYLNSLRLEAMLFQQQAGLEMDNFVRVDRLTQQQQGLLKESFLVVNRFKKLIEHHFKLHHVL
ncbi:putative nucleotidyltransferase substrate binding domain-containing protein [Thiosulfativibrio zosterae]|uniref:Cyclic nucleotide-binding protein n=1 Tax=Thiosulfativibrio zosterae TaxID=2675053 RepID=A0A6F8PNJ6_9GAMM|nr:putative nucleotidyltransferase substrate binding domain-containing protein [Thiosulfativibrio zosterae]BBP43607.1 cyclic nucleotide-binding protein [Thiosulfativibrio zosterae]